MLLRIYSLYNKCSHNITYSSLRFLSTTAVIKKRVTTGSTDQLLGSFSKNTKIQKPSSSTTLSTTTNKTPLTPKLKSTGSIVLDAVYEYTLKYPLCVLLIQVGDFYELYDTHATRYASLLDLKLTRKQVSSGHTVDFAGFPLRSLDRYLDTLVNRLGCRVAICEQLGTNTRDDGSILGVQRGITRIITPGTVIEEKYLDAQSNNYLLAVFPTKNDLMNESSTIGLAWVDLSVGEFIFQQSTLNSFKDDIVRIKPREAILPDWMRPYKNDLDDDDDNDDFFHSNWNNQDPITKILASEPSISLTYQSDTTFDALTCKKSLKYIFSQDDKLMTTTTTTTILNMDDLLFTFSDESLAAGMAILHYIDQTHVGKKPKLQLPLQFLTKNTLRIDSAAMISLELLKGLKDGNRKGSLLGTLDHTVTDAGSRLLSQWISSPLGNLELIDDRLDVVNYFYHDSFLLNDIRYQLKQSTDTQRVLQRLIMGRGQYMDLIDIHSTLSVIKSIQQLFENQNNNNNNPIPTAVKKLLLNLNSHDHLSKDIQLAFIDQHVLGQDNYNNYNDDDNDVDDDDDGSDNQLKGNHYGNVNPNYHPTLKRLYNKMKKLEKKKKTLQDELQMICGRSITLTTNSPYRHIVEVNASQAKKLEDHYYKQEHPPPILVHQTKNKKRYHLQDWTDLSIQLEETTQRIIDFEAQVFQKLVEQLLKQSNSIIQSCATLAKLDTLTTFSWLANKNHWVRPQLCDNNNNNNNDHDIEILKGRHPVIETYLEKKGRSFTKNDCQLTTKDHQRIWLLTGPNMGGKSTFLRQNAIIVILAHMGCFVPAEKAKIGLTDCIFSRVGAADNITQDQSTFMVEMTETANILKNATSKSLVIMDEVGRGTSTSDGFSIAFAILEYIHQQIGCKTLFATHYHELADAVHSFQYLKCFKTSLHEDDDGFTFLHRVEPGVCKQSHGLKVAQIAGLPTSVINTAKSVWQSLSHAPLLPDDLTKKSRIMKKKKKE